MKTPVHIKDTAKENVLIKKRVLNASRYQKQVIQHAKKCANIDYQKMISEKESIYQIAYQQGYNDGVKTLLTDFINEIKNCETTLQKQVIQSAEQLENLLMELFNDLRIKEIVAHHFLQKNEAMSHIQLHVPVNMQSALNSQYPEIQIQTSENDNVIALEAGNEICYFSPHTSAKNTLPHIFSIENRCQILKQHKESYQTLIELLHIHRGEHESTNK